MYYNSFSMKWYVYGKADAQNVGYKRQLLLQ
jgi:hypothetical protein